MDKAISDCLDGLVVDPASLQLPSPTAPPTRPPFPLPRPPLNPPSPYGAPCCTAPDPASLPTYLGRCGAAPRPRCALSARLARAQTFPRLHERLGDFAVHRKRFREAEKHYRQGLEHAPEHQGSLPRFPAASASATRGAADRCACCACCSDKAPACGCRCTLGLKDALKKLQEEQAPKPAAAAEALAASGIGAHVEVKEAPGRGRFALSRSLS
jgi:hypothetical protein